MEKINAKPTKLFFIDMLTRDITVSDAIGDLVDNSVDAARSEIYRQDRQKGKFIIDLFALKYENTTIDINFNEDEFSILDNAGGIPYNIAKEYAFCFGRPEKFDGTPGSIGQFGIGMKRSFFKIGKKISIESATHDCYFKIEIDVEKWKEDTDNWDFEITDKKDKENSFSGYGTKITISDLYESSKELFKNEIFLNGLRKEIEIENWYNLSKGMLININHVPLIARDLSIKEDSSIGLKIGKWQHSYEGVDVRIICGVGEKGKKEDGGWYIFCNDRLILASEKTSITGWSGKGRKTDGGPEYHSQYERFRGFVFFESQSTKDFPWNTAKTSLNPEHPLYIKVRSKMVDMMKDVNAFLNNIKSEKDGQGRGKNQPLSPTEKKLEQAMSLSIRDVATKTLIQTKFAAPETIKLAKNSVSDNIVTINYEIDVDKYNQIAKSLNLSDPRDVGLHTFNYYYENEI